MAYAARAQPERWHVRNRRFIVLLLLASSAAVTLLCSAGAPVAALPLHTATTAVPGQLIVGFEGTVAGVESRAGMVEAAGASLERDLLLPGYSVVTVAAGSEDATSEALLDQPGIVSVERNLIRRASFVPNDAYYERQWNLGEIAVERAWDQTKGAGATVAVLDTGVAYEDCAAAVCGQEFRKAPDFAGTSFVHPWDIVTNDSHANDQFGHGTHVASTIAEATNNRIGAASVAPDAAIMPVRVLDASGYGQLDWIVDGIYWATEHGADVINMSLGSFETSGVEQAAIDHAVAKNVIVVAAAGNAGEARLDCPACYPGVIAVGATTMGRTLANYSSYGAGVDGQSITVVAPGGDIFADDDDDGFEDGVVQQTFQQACELGGGAFDYTTFGYCAFDGTSMATPHVAGIAALVLSVHPTLTVAEVRDILMDQTTDLGQLGPDDVYGSGLVNARAAVRAAIALLPESEVRGDANCNGDVNVTDAAVILQRDALVIARVGCPHNADLNDDGRTDVLDALLILQYAARLLNEL